MAIYQITGSVGGINLTDPAYGNPLTITDTGIVAGSYNSGTGLYDTGITTSQNWTIENAGAISGGTGISLGGGGSVTNAVGGVIHGIGYGYGVAIAGAAGTVDNAGAISGYRAVLLSNGGSVTNEIGGTISGFNASVYITGATGTVDNVGAISGPGVSVYLNAGGSVTNETGGTISGYFGVFIGGASGTVENAGAISGGTGVSLGHGGSVTNETGGTISGASFGVFIGGASGTVENAGTINGDTQAVNLNATVTNRLIVDAGAVFNGTVSAKATATNTLELTSGAAAGTISGLGTHYTGFQTVTIDSGATWTIGGTKAGFNGTTIAGFTADDRLDLTNLTFSAGDTIDLDHITDVLTIKDSGGTVLDTIQLAGSFTGDFFHLTHDSGTGSFITEDTTPCYCRGTRIRTLNGDAAVESLKIGDQIMTADGKALPLKWIGRRSYRDWLAVGNPEVQPIRFKAGSISDHVPVRDLYVSPEHAMFLDGMLIPALHLVNGVSILKIEGMEEIDYFHLEFDRHVVIFAEGAAAESFVDDGSRMLFHNADEYRRLYADEPPRRDVAFCAPRVEDGYALEATRRALRERATRLRPDGNAAPAPITRGYLDRATRSTIEGWAIGGDGPVALAILVNGAVIGRTVANRYRADLKTAGLGDGCNGFRFDLPQPLPLEIGHRVEVRREDNWGLLPRGAVSLAATSRPHTPLSG